MPEHQREMLSLVTARVRDAFVRKPFYLDGTTDLVSACRELSRHGQTSALVRDGERLGIFTTTDLRDALLRPEPPAALPVKAVARFDIVSVDADSELFEALWLMVRHRVHRLVVREGERVVGLLGQLDLVSFVANHSHIVALQIEEAETEDQLAEAAARIDQMVSLLHGSGIRIERVARLVSELNLRLMARLWSLLAPPGLVANSCLFVMGSEGRGEQLLKTDQDNGLVLRDGYEPSVDVAAVCAAFSQALADFGYPPCPGGIMVSQPGWRLPQTQFCQAVRQWWLTPGTDHLMNLAIFMDAHAVAGDPALLEPVRQTVLELAADNDAVMARFAAAINLFGQTSGWWNRLFTLGESAREAMDIKKAGMFPLVHGVRSLALAHRITETATARRIEALRAIGKLPDALATDLTDSLHFFMGLRLKAGMQELDKQQPVSGGVLVDQLSSLDRDLLKDTLGVVKQLRQLLTLRFHLEAV